MSADLTAAGWRSHDVGGFFGNVGTLWSRKEADGWAYGLLTDQREPQDIAVEALRALLVAHGHRDDFEAMDGQGRLPLRPCVKCGPN